MLPCTHLIPSAPSGASADVLCLVVFFFQAEDGIRARDVTGVQTCALPISVRLGQKPSLAFAPREMAEVHQQDGRWHLRTLGLGMLGPNGPMPLHFTEWVRERSQAHHDETMADFLDIFHHRFLTQFYLAWNRAQSVTALDRPDADHFSFFIDALGHTQSAHDSPLPAHARLAAACHLVRQARNPDGLQQCLAHFFAVPVAIEEFALRWM